METNAKMFLRQYKACLIDIRNMEAELHELRSIGTSVTSHIELVKVMNAKGKPEERGLERVRSSGTVDKIGGLITRIESLETAVISRRAKSLDKLQEIEATIDEVPDETCRQILHMRYIELETWEQIAVSLNYNYRWTLRLHGRALAFVTEILNKP